MSNSPGRAGASLVLGKVGKVHGVRGWVRLISSTDPAQNILRYKEFQVPNRAGIERLVMDGNETSGKYLVCHFAGFDDPESARGLTGAELAIDPQALPELPEGEYYWHNLIGMAVINEKGQFLGRVSTLVETGAHDVLDVRPATEDDLAAVQKVTGEELGKVESRARLIPFVQGDVVTGVDLEQQVIRVTWDADYLA